MFAPPCSTARISSPRKAKFAARMEGAISTIDSDIILAPILAHSRRPVLAQSAAPSGRLFRDLELHVDGRRDPRAGRWRLHEHGVVRPLRCRADGDPGVQPGCCETPL